MEVATIFNHETVALDGQHYDGCTFQSCRMVYAGGPPPVFTDCSFADCEWTFGDAAARTLAYLKLMWAVGGKAPVQGLIKEITGAGGR